MAVAARGGWCAKCIKFYWMRVLCVCASDWHSVAVVPLVRLVRCIGECIRGCNDAP